MDILSKLFRRKPKTDKSPYEYFHGKTQKETLDDTRLNNYLKKMGGSNPEVRHDMVALMSENLRVEYDPLRFELLVTALFHDPAALVRGEAALAVVRVNGPKAIPLLEKALDDQNDYARRMVVTALGMTTHPSAATLLLRTLEDNHADVREEAARTLGEIGDKTAASALVRASTSDSDARVRHVAARVLKKMKG